MNEKYKLNKEWLDLLLEHKNNANITFNLSNNDTRILLTYIEFLQQENQQLKDRITNAIERLEALITFWKKYNPIDNTMQVEQFNGVISLLKEVNKEKVDENN